LDRAIAAPLGATLAPDGCRFAVYAHADAVWVRLVHPGTRRAVLRELDLESSDPSGARGGIWAATLPGDWRGWSYSFELTRQGERLADIVDPWAALVRNDRAYVVADRTPVSPRPPMRPEEAILYELHIRDFTRDQSCGVKPEWRGKFLGLAQSGTRLEGSNLATGLDHIRELGVTVVQLMPVHGFAMPYNPEYEWGYMPNDFNAPHAGYASGVELDAPVREFKRLVSALHEAGLRVTLDVVFNHTAERWPSQLRSLMALAPTEYFRFRPDGTPWDGSNCGNEVRSESPMGRRLIVESCLNWVINYGVDGFRFDLMGLIDIDTLDAVARAVRNVDPSILLYGEPWGAAPAGISITGRGAQRGRGGIAPVAPTPSRMGGWAIFDASMRDGLRGDVFDPNDLGFLAAGADVEQVKDGILGGVRSFTDSPLESVNYIECHDNHTLMDRLAFARPRGEALTLEERDQMSRLGVLILMTSQGIPFIHSGQEFGRTKHGHADTYNLGDQINNIRWRDKQERHRLFAFYRDVIHMRRQHPMFRLTSREDVLRAVSFLDRPDGRPLPDGVIAFMVRDVTGRDSWARACVLLNGARSKATVPHPAAGDAGGGAWHVFPLDGLHHGRYDSGAAEIELAPHSGVLLYQPR